MAASPPLRVLGETAYPVSVASARVRLHQFAPFLTPQGVELRYRPTLTEDEYGVVASTASPPRKAAALTAAALRAARRKPAHDLLLIHRLRFLTPLPGLDPPARLDVYDLDDALFLGSSAEVNRGFGWLKREAERCVRCLQRARLVIAGNPYLADTAAQHARRVEVVPTCVDPEQQPLHEHRDVSVVTVGWIGSHSTAAYLKPLLPVFATINRSKLQARLVVVGADLGLEAEWLEQRAWSLASERDDLASFDIGIMPLPNTDWARGKCGYKLLQYFSAGIPVIASPVGVNVNMVGSERGLLANEAEAWRAALERLLADAEERRERGRLARTFMESSYSYKRWAPELAALLRTVQV